MDDRQAKLEALRSAIHYHATNREKKRPTPAQIVATAEKFTSFLLAATSEPAPQSSEGK